LEEGVPSLLPGLEAAVLAFNSGLLGDQVFDGLALPFMAAAMGFSVSVAQVVVLVAPVPAAAVCQAGARAPKAKLVLM
jgi:hypothetical protein